MSTEASFADDPAPQRPSSDQPAGPVPGTQPNEPSPHLAPGDQAAPGTPGTGEDVCPQCGGSGRTDEGRACPECEGTGKVTVGIGGA
jgi:hypothetical protein